MEDTLNKLEIGQRIRKLRLQHDLTQAELAEELDISVNFLSEIENGKKGLSQDSIAKICTKLQCSADYLLFGESKNDADIVSLANTLSAEELKVTISYLQALLKVKETFKSNNT